MNQTTWILLITKGILRDRGMRRKVLFWIVLVALGLLGAGATLFDAWLLEHRLLFLVYWGICLWLTLTSALLAFYDLLALRAEAHRERQELKRRILGDAHDGSHPPEP